MSKVEKAAIDTMFRTRWMIRSDYDAVCYIDEHSNPDPMTVEDLTRMHNAANVVGLVSEDHSLDVAAYLLYQMHETRIRILRMGVYPAARRQGHGTGLVNRVTEKPATKLAIERDEVSTVVRESDLPAQLMFRKAGFVASLPLLHDYFADGERGYYMRYVHPIEPSANRISGLLNEFDS